MKNRLLLAFMHAKISKLGVFTVRFGLDLKNQPNYINFVKYKPNRTENRFKPNRPDSVKSGFLGKKPENLNPNPDPPTQNSTWSFALSSKS